MLCIYILCCKYLSGLMYICGNAMYIDMKIVCMWNKCFAKLCKCSTLPTESGQNITDSINILIMSCNTKVSPCISYNVIQALIMAIS